MQFYRLEIDKDRGIFYFVTNRSMHVMFNKDDSSSLVTFTLLGTKQNKKTLEDSCMIQPKWGCGTRKIVKSGWFLNNFSPKNVQMYLKI